METEGLVYVDIAGTPRLAGRLWARARKGRESASFEYDSGWLTYPERFSLEPALTLGPVPSIRRTDIKPRVLTTAIDLDDGSASLDLALCVAGYFELDADQACAIAAEVGRAVAIWREEATRLGLTQTEIERMTSAFEHNDLRAALAGH